MSKSQTRPTIKKLKTEYVKYFEDVPIQRYAALFVGRDEDTIIRWRRCDMQFADAVQRAKAKWIRKKVVASKAEFALERLEKEMFSQDSLRDRDGPTKLNNIVYMPVKYPDDYDQIHAKL